jgi:2-(1,2-epoxy-1,2-dihydrophenyl)acetyl-CoA isomerase
MEYCIFERKGPVARFTLNRPDKRNAYSGDMWTGMRRACDELKEDVTARVLVVTGAGDKAFCAGPALFSKTPGTQADRGWYEEIPSPYKERLSRLQSYKRHEPIWDLDIPVVCRLNGLAVGAGADWVVACDLIVAADHAFLGWWYTKRGLATDMGGCWYLTQLVGPNKAKEIIFTARNVEAQELVDLGIAVESVPYAQLDDAVDKLCNQIIDCAPLAVRADKDLINHAVNMPKWPWFEYSTHLIVGCIDSEDFKTQRFSALRGGAPEWQGR